ncbi:MAG: DUF3857 domain-containing protein [Bacteroidota bacterium]
MRYFIAALLLLISPLRAQELEIAYNSIPDRLLENADAVVRLDNMEVIVTDYNAMIVTATRAVTVLNENGNKYVHAYAYYDDNQKITDLSAVVYNHNGSEIEKFKERDFLDHSASGDATLYSDDRVKYLRYTPISYPYTIIFKKAYKTPDTAFLPNWYFLDGYGVSTQKSEYTLHVQCEVPFRFKENNLEAFGVQGEHSEKRRYYHAENISAIKREPYAPSFSEFSPNVRFALEKFHLKGVDGQAKNWEEFGKWIYTSLLTGQDELDEATILKIKELVSGVDDPKEKVKRIYGYVQNNTRYISVQLGIGGWKPISAREVDRVKYGDCKGLTNYTKALLKEVGIESFYTVVYADSPRRDIDPDFPALQGNHAFLNVPLADEELWLECTSQEVPVNYLGTFTDNRYVLKVTAQGGKLVKTGKYEDVQNFQSTKANLTVDEAGAIQAKVTIASKGIKYNQKYRLVKKKSEEIETHYKEYWDYVNNLKIQYVDFQNNKDGIELVEKVQVKAENYISNAGGKWLFSPNMFNRNQYVPKRTRQRKNSVVVQRGYLDEDEFVITLPSNIRVETLLPPQELTTDFGEYKIEMEKISATEIRYKRRLLIKSGIFPKERYDEFREFRKKVARSDNSKIVLIKT